ncbi:MAG: chemotaxis protein CheW [Bacteroidales bacterium]|nr:chemotaxis protein CheW [Bacteroidales bacterium]
MEKDTIYQSDSYLTFKVGGENFAASVNKVLNILEMSKITKVPQAPEYMLGVINLRGQVLPVIDSRIKFGMPVSEITKNSFIIVIEVLIDEKIVQLGALVDSVNEVLEVTQDTILPPPSIGNRYKTDFISGVLNVNDEFIMVLDIDKAFSTDEIIQFQTNNEIINNK